MYFIVLSFGLLYLNTFSKKKKRREEKKGKGENKFVSKYIAKL